MYIITSSIVYYLPVYSYTDFSWRVQIDLKIEWIQIKHSLRYNFD